MEAINLILRVTILVALLLYLFFIITQPELINGITIYLNGIIILMFLEKFTED